MTSCEKRRKLQGKKSSTNVPWYHTVCCMVCMFLRAQNRKTSWFRCRALTAVFCSKSFIFSLQQQELKRPRTSPTCTTLQPSPSSSLSRKIEKLHISLLPSPPHLFPVNHPCSDSSNLNNHHARLPAPSLLHPPSPLPLLRHHHLSPAPRLPPQSLPQEAQDDGGGRPSTSLRREEPHPGSHQVRPPVGGH